MWDEPMGGEERGPTIPGRSKKKKELGKEIGGYRERAGHNNMGV